MLMPSIFGENLLDDFFDFGRPVRRNTNVPMNRPVELMKTDVKETETGYELEINLPGYKKEDIQAELKDGYLTVQATTSKNTDEKDENGRYIRRERYSGSCSRSFYVGEDITQEDIKAKYENGVLALSVPKKEPKQPEIPEKKYITIDG